MDWKPNLKSHVPILYVEDEETDVLLLKQAFTRAGVSNPLTVAEDGQKAIDYLAREEGSAEGKDLPGLVLVDLNLPRKNGFEVIKWIKENPKLSSLLVVLTSSDDGRDIERAYKSGAHGYIRKPSNLNKLVQTVQVLKDYWLGVNEFPPHPIWM